MRLMLIMCRLITKYCGFTTNKKPRAMSMGLFRLQDPWGEGCCFGKNRPALGADTGPGRCAIKRLILNLKQTYSVFMLQNNF